MIWIYIMLYSLVVGLPAAGYITAGWYVNRKEAQEDA